MTINLRLNCMLSESLKHVSVQRAGIGLVASLLKLTAYDEFSCYSLRVILLLLKHEDKQSTPGLTKIRDNLVALKAVKSFLPILERFYNERTGTVVAELIVLQQ